MAGSLQGGDFYLEAGERKLYLGRDSFQVVLLYLHCRCKRVASTGGEWAAAEWPAVSVGAEHVPLDGSGAGVFNWGDGLQANIF